jgi:hypothetical protein
VETVVTNIRERAGTRFGPGGPIPQTVNVSRFPP